MFFLLAFHVAQLNAQDNLLSNPDINVFPIEFSDDYGVFIKWKGIGDCSGCSYDVSLKDEVFTIEKNSSQNSIYIKNVPKNRLVSIIVSNRAKGFLVESEFETKNPRFLDVSEDLYAELESWGDEASDAPFYEYVMDENFERLELISFFSRYYYFTPSYLESIKNDIESVDPVKLARYFMRGTNDPDVSAIDVVGPSIIIVDPPDPNEDDDVCRCRMIKTLRLAANIPNEAADELSWDCTDGKPRTNYEFGRNHKANWHLWEGLFGAGKGVRVLANAGRSHSADMQFASRAQSRHHSRLRFLQSCYDPRNAILSQGCNCTKQVELNYVYSSRIKTDLGDDGRCIYGDRERMLHVEDYAMLSFVQNGELYIHAGGAKLDTECSNTSDTSWRTNFVDVVEGVAGMFSSRPSIDDLINTGFDAYDLFTSLVNYAEPCTEVDSIYQLLNATAHLWLVPNKSTDIIISTGYEVEAFAKNCRASVALSLASTGYLGAILKDDARNDTLESYCCPELIGSYVVFGIEEFDFGTFDYETSNGNVVTIDHPLNYVAEKTPTPMGDLRRELGAFFHGYLWCGGFEESSCCDGVKIDCYSKCVYCSQSEDCMNARSANHNKVENNQQHSVKIRVYPNPFDGYSFTMESDEKIDDIQLYNLQGNRERVDLSDYGDNRWTIRTDLYPGVYLLKLSIGDEEIVKKLIVKR